MSNQLPLKFNNWNENGNNYLLHGNPKNRWVGFQKSVIDKLIKKFDNNFYIVIYGDNGPDDYIEYHSRL